MLSKALTTAAAGNAGGEVDEYFNQTTLLLHGDGTNGAQNNTFLDSSTNNFTITRNGNTTQGTFSPFSAPDGRWSNYFDGVDDTLISSGTPFSFGAGNFTFEMWIYPLPVGSFAVIVNTNTSGGVGGGITSAGNITIGRALVATDGTTSNSVTFNAWNHIAWVRNSGTVKIYINGVEGFSGSLTYNYPSGALRLGSDNNNTLYYPGYISNVRLSASAVYTSGFTPSTSPLTTNTSPTILTAQSNRFLDNSGNDLTFTTQGAPSVQPFSPFAPSAAYSTSVNGGSGYFDGTGDYLQVPAGSAWDFGTGAFTMEMWVYPALDEDNAYKLFGINQNGSNQWEWAVTTFLGWGMYWYWGNYGSNQTEKYTGQYPIKGQWNHVVVCRDASYTWRFYLNGVLLSTSLYEDGTTWSDSRDFNNTSINPRIGENFKGYISDVMITKGSSLYSGSTISLPTAPLTAVSGTQLLCHFTNAGIFDNTGKNNLETVGDAQIDTTTKKYGTGSMEFDGTGDWLLSANGLNKEFNAGPFTIECWAYITDNSTRKYIVSAGVDTASHYNFALELGSVGKVNMWASSNGSSWDLVTSDISEGVGIDTIPLNQWNHIAMVRESNGTFKSYLNGSLQCTVSGKTAAIVSQPTQPLNVGRSAYLGNFGNFNGFIDDLRITRGVARYTSNFTVPDKAFPNQ